MPVPAGGTLFVGLALHIGNLGEALHMTEVLVDVDFAEAAGKGEVSRRRHVLVPEEDHAEFTQRYNEWGIWVVLTAGVTPFPYKVITILSGATGLSLPVFIVTSFVARGLRFFLVAALLWKFGAPIRDFIERRLGLMFTLFVVLLAGGFYVVKYL